MLLLNLMIPAIVAFNVTLGGMLSMLLAMPLSLLAVPQTAAYIIGGCASFFASVFIAHRCARRYVVPRPLSGKALAGHRILAGATLLGAVVALSALALLYFQNKAAQPIHIGLGLATIPVVGLAWAVGWYMVATHKPAALEMNSSAYPVERSPSTAAAAQAGKLGLLSLINLMVPAMFAIYYIVGNSVTMFIGFLVLPRLGLADGRGVSLAMCVSLSLSGVGAYFLARRRAAMQRPLSGKARLGHGLIAFGTVAAVLAMAGPIALAYVAGKPDYAMYTWFALAVIPCSAVLWAIGWYLAGKDRNA